MKILILRQVGIMSQEVENIKSIVQTASNSFLRVVIKNVTSHYDKMNRLTDIYLGTTHSQIVYDPLGRMTDKEADGVIVFANAGFAAAQGQPAQPHAMKSAETAEGVFPSATQEITYTGFDKVKTIAEGGNTLEYTYGEESMCVRW